MHRVASSAIPQKAGHTDVKWIVVLDVHLSAKCVPNRGLDLFRKLQYLLARTVSASTTEQSDGLCFIDSLCQRSCLTRIRESHWAPLSDFRAEEPVRLYLLGRNIAWNHDDGHTISTHGGLDCVVNNTCALLCGVDYFAVARALLEDHLRVGFLKELGTDLHAGNVGCNREDFRAIAVGIVETLDEVGVSTTGTGADCEVASDERFSARRESCCFLVANMDPLNV